jgi:DNA-binding transcriptional ArsR family regulator
MVEWIGMQKSARQVEKILKALANHRRLAIVVYIKRRGSANVGDISEAITLSFKATSKHLGVLYAAGIVDREQVSLTMNYSLTRPLHSLTSTALSIL